MASQILSRKLALPTWCAGEADWELVDSAQQKLWTCGEKKQADFSDKKV